MMNKEEILKDLKGIDEQIKTLEKLKADKVEALKKDGQLDFDTWYKYADKEALGWLVEEDEALLICEAVDDCEGYMTITLENILDWTEDWEDEELEKLQAELMKFNFGSMKKGW